MKLNKDGSVPKKRGPKPGSKRAPKTAPPVSAKSQPEYDELDDLLGLPPATPAADDGAGADQLLIDDVYRGVSITWLANAFKMDRQTVRKRLAHCPSLAQDRSQPLYSLRQAAAYLVEPKIDIGAYLKAMRPNDLPPLLQDTFWSAQMKRQKWELEAGNLWRTEDVLSVLGEAAKRIRTAVTLWADNLDRVHGLSGEQRKMLTGMCDGLLDDVYETLVDMPKSRRTSSQLSELAEMESAEAGRVKDINAPVDVS